MLTDMIYQRYVVMCIGAVARVNTPTTSLIKVVLFKPMFAKYNLYLDPSNAAAASDDLLQLSLSALVWICFKLGTKFHVFSP